MCPNFLATSSSPARRKALITWNGVCSAHRLPWRSLISLTILLHTIWSCNGTGKTLRVSGPFPNGSILLPGSIKYMQSSTPQAWLPPNILPSVIKTTVFALDSRSRASPYMRFRKRGRITLCIVVSDGRLKTCTASTGGLRRIVWPGRGQRTTPTEAPSAAALRYIFASSRLLRLDREPIPSSTSDCIANTHSARRY